MASDLTFMTNGGGPRPSPIPVKKGAELSKKYNLRTAHTQNAVLAAVTVALQGDITYGIHFMLDCLATQTRKLIEQQQVRISEGRVVFTITVPQTNASGRLYALAQHEQIAEEFALIVEADWPDACITVTPARPTDDAPSVVSIEFAS